MNGSNGGHGCVNVASATRPCPFTFSQVFFNSFTDATGVLPTLWRAGRMRRGMSGRVTAWAGVAPAATQRRAATAPTVDMSLKKRGKLP
jgi:hypothetical protein